jgi:uncharacterized membrane protein YphA (DoxX/SURF4 family)
MKALAQMNLLDRLAGAIEPLFATRPDHVIALLGRCAAYIQGSLTKLLDFSAAVAETQSFGLPFAAAATGATPQRFMAENSFFEHLELVGGFLLVAGLDVRKSYGASL